MDHLWSPWRYRYVTSAEPKQGCVFCRKPAENQDQDNFILHRGTHCYVLLNLYPYTTGHLMVVPYAHVSTLEEASEEASAEMMQLTRHASRILRATYRPDGMNLGMNLGTCAGAGIAQHIHMHVLPRWTGDANFLSTVGETRVMPEELPVTWEKLRAGFAPIL